MKTLINITLLSFAVLFTSMLNAQDTVKKKNGEVLKVVVKEINDSQIKYYHFDDPNQVLFTLDRMTITEIKFAYGKEYKEKESIMTDDYFTEDQNMVLSLSMSSMLFDAIIISFDKAIDPKSGFQITGKLLGIGFGQSFENWYNRSGFDLEVGYKLKFSGLKKKKWEYRPNNLLSGRYIMHSVGFTTYSEDRSSSQIKKNLIHLGLKFGNLKIIQKLITVDYYTGFAYFGGSKKRTLNSYGSDVDFEYNDINAGDLFGSGNFAVTFGFKVGLAFGQYGEQKEKLKRRK